MKNDIRAILEGLGYTIPEAKVYANIGIWRDWYQGYQAKFHDYTQYNGRRKIKRRRKSLRMAKRVCEDHANLLLNEKVQLTVSNVNAQKKIDEVLKVNDFRVQANKLVELAFALGTGAFVEHDDGNSGVILDYVRADMIFPTKWEGEKVSDCVFASTRSEGKKNYIYLNIHTVEANEYVIYNKLVPLDADGNAAMVAADPALPGKKRRPDEAKADATTGLLAGGLNPEVHTGSMTPRFQFIGPNQVNNIDLGSPLGISTYANSLDLLEGIDLVYDSYCSEFRLGKKRIIIPQTMLELMQDDQSTWMAFDDNDTEFYGLKDDNLTEIKEINMELRIEQHDQAMQRFVDLLSAKCGLGNDHYQFTATGLKTATEVVSEKSELYQSLKKNELVLEAALQDMCAAIAEIAGIKEKFETVVNFDDSIIEDTDAKRTRMQALVTQGKFPLWRYLFEYEGYTKKEAEEISAEVAESQPEELDFPGDAGAAGGGPDNTLTGAEE